MPSIVPRYIQAVDSLTRKSQSGAKPDDYYFFWYLNTDQWNYFFINGKMRLSASIADAEKAPPVHLGGPCKWDISTTRKDGTALVSAGFKDQNGCTLRSVSQGGKRLSPRLSLIKDGKTEVEKTMEFG